MAKLKETSESVIILNLLVMNLDKRLRLLLLKFRGMLFGDKNQLEYHFNLGLYGY